jgi:uncharacterized surface protein with fasciclin (FAS1) repeats
MIGNPFKAIGKFFSNLFSKKKVETKTDFQKELDLLNRAAQGDAQNPTHTISAEISCPGHFVKYNCSKLYSTKILNPVPGESKLGSISSLDNPDQQVEFIAGKITSDVLPGVMFKLSYGDDSATLSMTYGKSAPEEEVKNYKDFFQRLLNQLSNIDILKNNSFEINVTRSMFGTYIEFQKMKVVKNTHIKLNNVVKFAIENFIHPCLGASGKDIFLFTGNYGNGKTETALDVIHYSSENYGKTGIYIRNTNELQYVLTTFTKFELLDQCVFFAEDIDQVASSSDRSDRMNGILNIIDGAMSKNNSFKLILTTNHEARLNQALRRPGRIDVIVQFNSPDVDTTEEIIRSMLPNLEDFDYTENAKYLVETLSNPSGSVIAQCCKRVMKLPYQTSNNFKVCVDSMISQVQFMREEIETSPKDEFIQEVAEGLVSLAIQNS